MLWVVWSKFWWDLEKKGLLSCLKFKLCENIYCKGIIINPGSIYWIVLSEIFFLNIDWLYFLDDQREKNKKECLQTKESP